MTPPQGILFGILALTLVLFVWGRWRYDVVALLALLSAVLLGLVPGEEAFSGFGHTAVITVAAVLVVSRGLRNSGIVDLIAAVLVRVGGRVTLQVAALTGLAALASAFMNNVGALALFLPVALRIARTSGTPPSVLLMPLAFGSLLGGLTTLIGTPPNIIIASFREQTAPHAFGLFDFTPAGAGIAVTGILFLSLLGWRLIPQRRGQAPREELFEIEDYITEVRVPADSEMVGRPARDLERTADIEVSILGVVRGGRRLPHPYRTEALQEDDSVIIEAGSEDLQALLDATGLVLVGHKALDNATGEEEELSVTEAVVTPGARIVGRTASSLNLRGRYGVNLLAVARQGRRVHERLSQIRFRQGDVLLLHGGVERLQEVLPALGCLPLAERGLRLGQPRRALLAVTIFAAALAAGAVNLLPLPVALVAAAGAMVLSGLVGLRESYDAIDWSVIVLLAAMLPVGRALETTGGAQLIARGVLRLASTVPPATTLAIIFIGTMFLSDVINNAAAAVLMAPVAINVALGVGVSADPFLMAVAVGASSAFLTPIGHQSNTLVMGPGGYRFGDYWRLGLPLEAVIIAVGLPLIIWVWPF